MIPGSFLIVGESFSHASDQLGSIPGTGGSADVVRYLKERVGMHQKIEKQEKLNSQILGLFESIDSLETESFLSFLSESCRFRFGSSPTLRGRDEIRESVTGLFQGLISLRHTLDSVWSNESVVIVRGKTRYVFKEGRDIEVPFCDVLELNPEGKIQNYEIYAELGSG